MTMIEENSDSLNDSDPDISPELAILVSQLADRIQKGEELEFETVCMRAQL